MAVNAAIEQLIARSGDWKEHARVIIAYSDTLKEAGFVQYEGSRTKTFSGDPVSGHTAEHGNVTMNDREHEEHEEWAYGIEKDRVGHHRLWKGSGGRLVCFHRFWKSSVTTRGWNDGPEEYHLGYNPESLEPIYLGILRRKVIFAIGRSLVFFRRYREPVFGSIPNPGDGFGVRIS